MDRTHNDDDDVMASREIRVSTITKILPLIFVFNLTQNFLITMTLTTVDICKPAKTTDRLQTYLNQLIENA